MEDRRPVDTRRWARERTRKEILWCSPLRGGCGTMTLAREGGAGAGCRLAAPRRLGIYLIEMPVKAVRGKPHAGWPARLARRVTTASAREQGVRLPRLRLDESSVSGARTRRDPCRAARASPPARRMATPMPRRRVSLSLARSLAEGSLTLKPAARLVLSSSNQPLSALRRHRRRHRRRRRRRRAKAGQVTCHA